MNSTTNERSNSQIDFCKETKDCAVRKPVCEKPMSGEYTQIWIKEERESDDDSYEGMNINIKEENSRGDETDFQQYNVKDNINIKNEAIKEEYSNSFEKNSGIKIKTENEYNDAAENIKIEIVEHPLQESSTNHLDETQIKRTKDEDEEYPQDGSTSQAEVIAGEVIENSDGKSMGKIFVENDSLQFECQICMKRVALCNRFRHMRIHSDERPHACPICHKSFLGKPHLKTHIKHHGEGRPYECTTCHKRFWQNAELIIHMRTHSGEKPFECETCNKKFAAKYNLNKHVRSHTGERPFECEICNKKFSSKSNLNKHLQAHSGQRPYECQICKKRYIRKHDLKKHTRIHK